MIRITIAGADKTSLVNWRDFNIEYNLTKEPDICLFSLKYHSPNQTYKPGINDEVIVTEPAGVTKIFAGRIIEIKDRLSSGKIEAVEVSCKDYIVDLDRKLVTKTYTNQAADVVIADIISTYTTGFTVTGVQTGAGNIKDIKFNYDYVSKAIQRVADLFGWDWYVDYDKDIKFFPSSGSPAPFGLGETAPDDFVVGSFEVKSDLTQVKNAIYVRGGIQRFSLSADNAEKYVADGQQAAFPLGHKFTPNVNFAVEKSTDGGSNWTSLTEGQFGVDDPNSFDILYDPNRPAIVFRENNKPANGNFVRIYGDYELPVIVYKSDEQSIAKYGTFEFRIVDNNIKSKDEASQKASAELRKYAEKATNGSFRTYKDGLAVGQEITINLPTFGVSNQKFKIQKIKRSIFSPNDGLGNMKYEYDVTIVASEIVGSVDILGKLLIDNINQNIEIDQNEIIDVILGYNELITLSEAEWSVVAHPSATPTFSEVATLALNDRVNPFGVDVVPIWVAGEAYPVDGNDRNRQPLTDAGIKVT
jgi:hypothetical protein